MEWWAAVDRVEGDGAVLIPESQPEAVFVLRCNLLPGGLRDGLVLRIRIEVDAEATEARRREIEELQDGLPR